MNKKIHSIDAYDISEEEYHELCKQRAAQRVVEAVTQYNELISQSGHFADKNVNVLLIKEAEEEEAKAFLDGVFDIIQKRE
jgi:predicted metal-binding transcription factor (methanogenesis marker protein 9)